MILVDSSVWIDFLASTRSSHQAALSQLLHLPNAIGLPGPVMQEVLQGIREETVFRRVHEDLDRFPIVHADTETYVMAARLYRTLAVHGETVPPGDVTIAALAIQHSYRLYPLDRRHFDRIARRSALRFYQPVLEPDTA